MNRLARYRQQIARDNDLEMDTQTGVLFGVKNGYTVYLSPVNGTRQMELSVSVCRGAQPPDSRELAGVVKQTKALVNCKVRCYKAVYRIRGAMNTQKVSAYVREALETVTGFLRLNGYENCCQTCGKTGPTEVFSVSGAMQELCSECFSNISMSADLAYQQQMQKPENIIGGIVGALIGSLLGAISIVLIGQLGYISALSGVVMGVCTLKGYELLGGRISIRGIIISVILMLGMVYVGNRVDWALTVALFFEIDFWSAYQTFPLMLQIVGPSSYFLDMAMVYGFTALGAVPTVRNAMRRHKESHVTAKLRGQGAYDL